METDISKDAVAAQRMDDQVNILCGANSAEATVLRAQSDRIAELETNNERLDAELYDINLEYDQHQTKVSADFEGDCWSAMRSLLQMAGFDGWDEPDGVTAGMALDYLSDSWAAGSKAYVRIAELEAALSGMLKKRKSIETEIKSAHSNRGSGASGWMREDDRDFRRDVSKTFDDIAALIPSNPTPEPTAAMFGLEGDNDDF